MPKTDLEEKPLHLGHRQRLRERFLSQGPEALADYEIIEMLLFGARPQGDVKPLAKRLLSKFGSLSNLFSAEPTLLAKEGELSDTAIASLLIVKAAAERMLREQIAERPVIQSWTSLLDYCRLSMAHEKNEAFRILFLNHKNTLIADEVQQTGTVNHTPVYPREVVKRALELGASAVILVHNHPSGDPTPSKDDIEMTKQIMKATQAVGISVHDHLVIGHKGHYSFKSNGLI